MLWCTSFQCCDVAVWIRADGRWTYLGWLVWDCVCVCDHCSCPPLMLFLPSMTVAAVVPGWSRSNWRSCDRGGDAVGSVLTFDDMVQSYWDCYLIKANIASADWSLCWATEFKISGAQLWFPPSVVWLPIRGLFDCMHRWHNKYT